MKKSNKYIAHLFFREISR